MKSTRVAFVSLGCAKNLVDSEKMLGQLAEAGCAITTDPDDADAIVREYESVASNGSALLWVTESDGKRHGIVVGRVSSTQPQLRQLGQRSPTVLGRRWRDLQRDRCWQRNHHHRGQHPDRGHRRQ